MNNKLCAKALKDYPAKGTIGSEILFFQSLTSTFDKIKELPFSNGLTVVCANQTNGCGRLGRSWESSDGGVYLTFGLTHSRTDFELPFVTLICALGVYRVLSRYVQCSIKWPNDIVSNGKKICGILTKTMSNGDETVIFAGIGINVNNRFSENLPYAASLKTLTGCEANENLILTEILNEIDSIYFGHSGEEIIECYKDACINLGREVTLVFKNKELKGKCTSILPDGTMEVVTQNETLHVNSGEVSVKGIYE